MCGNLVGSVVEIAAGAVEARANAGFAARNSVGLVAANVNVVHKLAAVVFEADVPGSDAVDFVVSVAAHVVHVLVVDYSLLHLQKMVALMADDDAADSAVVVHAEDSAVVVHAADNYCAHYWQQVDVVL